MRLLLAILTCLTLLVPRTATAQSAALHTLLHDIFDDQLKRSPEFASAIGDFRYNDQLSDLSALAFNEQIAAEQGFLNRILLLDTSALSAEEKSAVDEVQQELTADLEASRSKPWELPLTPQHMIQADLAGLHTYAPFATVKDYDDYIARLHLVPRQLRQASENLLSGIDDNRLEPADVIAKALKQTEELAAQTAETSEFAAPLRRFPPTIPSASQKRISAELLDAIQTDVLPAYARFAKFLRVTELPAAQKDHPAIPDVHLASQAKQYVIVELRDRAKSTLGSKFDIQSFHELIVNSWQLLEGTLQSRVDAWIAANK